MSRRPAFAVGSVTDAAGGGVGSEKGVIRAGVVTATDQRRSLCLPAKRTQGLTFVALRCASATMQPIFSDGHGIVLIANEPKRTRRIFGSRIRQNCGTRR